MKFKSIRLINYIGIYNGMKINEIYIDFTKCKNNIVVIKGDNGSGKSTLFSAINILPDDSSKFIHQSNARKTIEVISGEFIYCIDYIYEYKNGGYTNKGYFYKGLYSDNSLELCNQNGNMTACKDLIFSEFGLDANFASLSELSSSNRGLVSKIPSMRKQNFNNIISGVEIYNQIYKTLSKRSSIFKSMINSITSKIRQLGDEEFLKSSIISAHQRVDTLEANKEDLIASIAKDRNMISILDPDGKIQESYNTMNMVLKELLDKQKSIYRSITLFRSKYPDIIADNDHLISLESSINKADIDKMSMQSEISRLILENEEKVKKLNEKRSKLDSLNNVTNYNTLLDMKSEIEKIISDSELFFKKAGIKDRSISSSEYVIGLNTLLDIKAIVDSMRDNYPFDVIENAVSSISYKDDVRIVDYPDIESIRDQIDNIKDINIQISRDIVEYNTLLKTTEKLKYRPDTCKDSTCYFIRDAVEAASKEPLANIERLQTELSDNESILSELEKSLEYSILLTDAINNICNICKYIVMNKSILDRLPNAHIFSDTTEFLKRLLNGSDFHEISEMYQYISEASFFEQYHNALSRLESINNEIKIYEAKNDLLEDLISEVNQLDKEVNDTYQRITTLQSNIKSIDDSVVLYRDRIEKINNILQYTTEAADIDSRISESKTNMNAISNAISNINIALDNIASNTNRLNNIKTQIQSLNQDINQMEFGIKQLAEYKAELEEFNAKYEKIEFMKKCSSPTKGIQLIFIELYLRDIINTANQLLSLVLGGEFSLLKPLIDDRSFNFPCIGDGLPHDDISSLSDGQSAIMSVILSSSIMYHSSTKYNILKFDEVDGQLDTQNRSQFLIMIDQVRSILQCEQCIIITHNEELDLRNTDLIILKNSDDSIYKSGANIIYSYIQ